jgi:hypothetical protein
MPKALDCRIALVALIAFAVWLFVILPLLYLPAQTHIPGEMLGVKYGEWVAALGGILGGIVGAGGAILAVYVSITGQRKEDTANVRAAVRTEVTTYSKYVIGALKTCEEVATQIKSIPTVNAEYVGKNLADPVIYPAVSDRIGLLLSPQATIEFYMRVAEAKSNLAAIKQRDARLNSNQAAMVTIQPSEVQVVADSLITALEMAKHIVAGNDPTRTKEDLFVQKVTLDKIEAALASAKNTFPNAESFKAPQTA